MEFENDEKDKAITCTSCHQKVLSPMYLTFIDNQRLCNTCMKQRSDQFSDATQEPSSPDKFVEARSGGTSSDGVFGCSMGCFGGGIYLIGILVFVSSLVMSTYMKTIFVDILALLGPLPVLYYAKKNQNRPLFWGFLIPYMLLLLLFGQCTGHL